VENNAKENAGVSVIIIGLINKSSNYIKRIYTEERVIIAKNINAYLANARNIIVQKESKNISNLRPMSSGIKAGDGGYLILSEAEHNSLISQFPDSINLIKNMLEQMIL